ncbi:glucose-1-phosphate cytidylyltransferase [Paenibacillus sp. FSL A5-0031]|uniref:glucose-1-phosphate cytidylyltransferase n=1 Tax=Paenibacillus sp. FSL A5-0031 TaxID=1920420 RepID=UPI00096E2BDA|nr:glucose-1-phosphate cytidylyltransferase [Paenibacillus sp. FSL A5-0031]OME77971.1 glucose-1-phosphate cytidylyltransferase [Paenibacillus sp. FSL A5-0031]
MRTIDKNTKVVILAGGFGTRISEESLMKPKPMIDIGDKPILWHIMQTYAHYGFTNFVICLGYKGYFIKEYFYHYFLHHSDVTFDLSNRNEMTIHESSIEPWKITLVDTGKETMTGGRLKRVQPYLGNKTFMLTYGDGVSDIDIGKLTAFHCSHNKLATVTATQPSGRFGALDIKDSNKVIDFMEKPKGDGSWINSGFFVMEPQLLDYIEGDHTNLEMDCMQKIANDGQLMAYKHEGFFQPMDTLRDKNYLEDLWKSGKALWKK